MTLKHITGNLLADLRRHPVLLHGVNVQGAFAAGFAAVLKTAYPECVPIYLAACAAQTLKPGGIVVYIPPESVELPRVIHAATQEFYGRKGRARIDWVRSALLASRAYLDEQAITDVAMPRIASGLGGLDWNDQVLPAVTDVFGTWKGTAFIYTLEQDAV